MKNSHTEIAGALEALSREHSCSEGCSICTARKLLAPIVDSHEFPLYVDLMPGDSWEFEGHEGTETWVILDDMYINIRGSKHIGCEVRNSWGDPYHQILSEAPYNKYVMEKRARDFCPKETAKKKVGSGY